MRSKIIKLMGHPGLREVAPEVTEITDAEFTLIQRMKLALASVSGYAIAANQIGVNTRIFVHNFNKKYEEVINPIIAEYDDELWHFDEGCLSIPDHYFPIWRPRRVLLRGLDVNGNNVRVEATDVLARIFQHEVDHLNGKLVIDLLSEDERSEFLEKWNKNKSKR